MKAVLFVITFLCILPGALYPQHLPHKINNQWHYDCTSIPGRVSYAAIASERVLVNGMYYWKIDRYDGQTGAFIETVYDRTEGDSLYIRKVACPEELIINFDWPVGHIEVNAIGGDCYEYKKLVSRYTRDVFGMNTMSYIFSNGLFCEGYADTVWEPFQPEITKEFGCYWGGDGKLVGAVLNGLPYGTLYPLPVEMISFTAHQINERGIQLEWSTATETNNSGFEIMRKEFGTYNSWEKIAFVTGKGTTAEPQQYVFNDNSIEPGTRAYRIIQYDYSGAHKLVGETAAEFVITPGKIILKQNYPNPFNPSTVIEYSLAAAQNVKLKIFDVMGSEIATLINEPREAGLHSVTFNAGDLSSGIYIYVLEAGSRIKTGQMLLLK